MKAIEVTLSDKRVINLREPRTDEMGVFLSTLPAFTALKAMSDAAQSCMGGVIVPIPEIAPALMAGLYRLLALLSGLTEDDLKALPVWDGLALMTALQELTPSSFTRGTSS
jgi:hypothetical protein